MDDLEKRLRNVYMRLINIESIMLAQERRERQKRWLSLIVFIVCFFVGFYLLS